MQLDVFFRRIIFTESHKNNDFNSSERNNVGIFTFVVCSVCTKGCCPETKFYSGSINHSISDKLLVFTSHVLRALRSRKLLTHDHLCTSEDKPRNEKHPIKLLYCTSIVDVISAYVLRHFISICLTKDR